MGSDGVINDNHVTRKTTHEMNCKRNQKKAKHFPKNSNEKNKGGLPSISIIFAFKTIGKS